MVQHLHNIKSFLVRRISKKLFAKETNKGYFRVIHISLKAEKEKKKVKRIKLTREPYRGAYMFV